MRNARIFLPGLGLLFSALVLNSGGANATTPDQQFAGAAKTYFEQYLATHPEAATQLGDHRFDTLSNDLSAKGVTRDAKLYRETLIALERIPLDKMSPPYRIDYRMLRDDLNASLFSIQVLKEYEWDPLGYNPVQGVYLLLARDFAPLATRLAAVQARLDAIPARLAAARANLKNPPRIHTETAILQNRGAIGLVRDELETYLKNAPEMKPKLAASRARAIAALETYGTWLQTELLPRSTRDFRLGADKYRRKLRFSLDSDIAPEAILRSAEADLVSTQNAMYETALPLYRQFFADKPETAVREIDHKALIAAVLNRLADERPNNDDVFKLAGLDLAEASAFIREKNLLTLPAEPVKIIVMPEFQRGVSVAFCDPAGALEKNGETFYAISPAPADWTPAQVESYFREYNHSMLKDLTVHEAMPGHYVQLALANRTRGPTLARNIIFSGTFAEGWGTYAEQMMVEAGYGGAPVKMQQLKMRLRLIINAIIDQKIHAGSMSEKEAMELMTREGFQEEREAAGKWRRALLTSTQLSTYYVGNLEVNAIRRDFEAKYGKGRLKEMHDQMLTQGTISPKYIRELMGL
ncbi:MAG TPA: DUF885 domain-containing protein [Usitatibacteraceae bacterium]